MALTVRELVTKWGFDVDDKDLQKFQNDIDKTKTKVDDIGKRVAKLGKTINLAFSLPVLLIGGAFIKSASDAQETISKFGTVFQGVSAESEKTAKNLARDFGLSSVKAKELLGDTGDLLTGFGFSQESALNLSKQVNELAVDLASFTNFSGGAEGASAALTKALLGERESVKSLGISILEADVKQRVALNTTKGLRFETERQAKAYATLQLAQEQSKNAIGDFARTSDNFANRQRIFRARLYDMSVSFGKLLLPSATKVLNVVIKLIDKINDMSEGTKRVVLFIGGFVAVLGPLLIVIGSIINAVFALTKAFAAVKLAFTAAKLALAGFNLQALLIPALVVAAIAAVALVIEDLIRFFRGEGSVTGIMVDAFKDAFAFIESKFNALPGFFRGLLGGILGVIATPIRIITNLIDAVKSVIDVATGKGSFKDVLGSIGKLAFEANPLVGAVKGATGGIDGALGIDSQPQAPIASKTQNNQSSLSVNAPINVTVPEGTPPEDVGPQVQEGINNAMNDIFRKTIRTNSPVFAF